MWGTSAALIAGVTVTQKVLRYSRIFQDCKPIRFNYRLPGCVCLGLSGISSRSINTSFGVTGTLISSLPMTVTPTILQPLCLVRWPLACLFSPVQPVRAAIRNYFATTRGPKAAKSWHTIRDERPSHWDWSSCLTTTKMKYGKFLTSLYPSLLMIVWQTFGQPLIADRKSQYYLITLLESYLTQSQKT